MSDKEVQELFGVSQEDMDKSKDIVPTLDVSSFLKDGTQTLDVTFVEDKPREVEFEDKQTGKMVKSKVITVMCMGDEYTLWLSAASLRTPVAQIYVENNGLKDITIRLRKTEGKHKKYGTVSYYRVTRVREDSE